MNKVKNSLSNLGKRLGDQEKSKILTFDDFLNETNERPQRLFRNIFQLFHDAVHHYVSKTVRGDDDLPELADFVSYNCDNLLVNDMDEPFFADNLFANRLINWVNSFREGRQQNKIYLFEGPPGSGKSTFLDNLLQQFENYTRLEEGTIYETLWRLDINHFRGLSKKEVGFIKEKKDEKNKCIDCNCDDYFDLPCPNHDHPILQIPKGQRRQFLDELITNEEFKERLFQHKEYEWVFKKNPCTICSSLYDNLLEKIDFSALLGMIFARKYHFSKRAGKGISMFNPGDSLPTKQVFTNKEFQEALTYLFKDNEKVQYFYSSYAHTNNGIFALMDVKSHNVDRFIDLHGIISDGVHKVGNLEEPVESLFLAVINPEDRKSFEEMESYNDRILPFDCRYVLDYKVETKINKNKFGKDIEDHFLPGVLDNFSRMVVATRLFESNKAIKEWLGNSSNYSKYCDSNFLMLKMDLYADRMPSWISESDRKNYTPLIKRNILGESIKEGEEGLTGRGSIQLFGKFFSRFSKLKKLITIEMLYNFFSMLKSSNTLKNSNEGKVLKYKFLDELVNIYDNQVLEQIKESLYDYNEELIGDDIKNYLWAINYNLNSTTVCEYTGDKIEVTPLFFDRFEHRLLGSNKDGRENFRENIRKEYLFELLREIKVGGKGIEATECYAFLRQFYLDALKANVLEPFLGNDNFGYAIKDYNTSLFNTYDSSLRRDVNLLINNLQKKFNYTKEGAQQVCIYAIDKGLINRK